jgi:Family of unknown function (DUF6335)
MTDPRLNSLIGADSEDDAEDDAYRAEVNGDEAVGGSTAVPDRNDTEKLAAAVGIVGSTPALENRDLIILAKQISITGNN